MARAEVQAVTEAEKKAKVEQNVIQDQGLEIEGENLGPKVPEALTLLELQAVIEKGQSPKRVPASLLMKYQFLLPRPQRLFQDSLRVALTSSWMVHHHPLRQRIQYLQELTKE